MNPENLSAREARRSAGLQSLLNLALVLVILLLVNYLGFKYYKHVDLSESQFYTLSPKTKDVLKKLDAPVNVYTFLDEHNPGQSEEVSNLLKEYQQSGGKNLIVEKVDTAYDPARTTELLKQFHFDGTDHPIIFTYKDRAPRFVKEEDLFEVGPSGQTGAFKGEQELTGALVALLEGKPSKVYFTVGHGEHSIQDTNSPQGYGEVAELLKNENVLTANLNLAQQGDVPDDADAIIIAGPSVAFSPIEAQALDKYLQNNGKVFFLVDPYVTSGLDDLLKKYGMKLENDLVLYRSSNVVTSSGLAVTVPLCYIYQGGFSAQPITAKLAQANLQLLIYDARSITLATDAGNPAPKTQFLLQTDADSWGMISKPGAPLADPKNMTYNKVTDLAGPMTIAAQYDGGTITDPKSKAMLPSTRLIVVGSSKFLENDVAETVGANFFTNGVDWLVKKDAVLDIAPKKPMQYGISLNPISYRTIVWSAAFVIPGIALVLGIFTWISRRK